MFYVITNVISCEGEKLDASSARPITREEVIAMCHAMGIKIVEDDSDESEVMKRLALLESTVHRLCSAVTDISCPTDRPTEREDEMWNALEDIPNDHDLIVCAVAGLSEVPPPMRNDTLPAPYKHEDKR